MRDKGYGTRITSPISRVFLHMARYSFVDDTDWLVGSEVPKSILRSRISNTSGGNCKVMEDGCSRDGIIVYLFEDEEAMMTIILLEM